MAASPQEAVEADMARLICESREILNRPCRIWQRFMLDSKPFIPFRMEMDEPDRSFCSGNP